MIEKILSKPTIVYCESISNGFIKRPYYALSNIPFLFAGILILIKGKGSKLSKNFGYLAITISILSTMYDTFDFYIFQVFDLLGMFIFVNYLLYLNLSRIFKGREKLIRYTLTFSVFFASILLITLQRFAGNIIFGTFVALLIATEIFLYSLRQHSNYRYWISGLLFFLSGALFWYLDFANYYCSSLGVLNGRAIFHYLTAISIYYLYKFYDSQNDSYE